MEISCREFNWQVSSLEQVCTSSLPLLSTLEDLYIYEGDFKPEWHDNVENTLWLELLHPFTTVTNLYLSKEVAARIAPALQELVGDRIAEALSTLQTISLEGLKSSGPVQEGIGQFVAARKVTSRSIAVTHWETEEIDDFDDDDSDNDNDD